VDIIVTNELIHGQNHCINADVDTAKKNRHTVIEGLVPWLVFVDMLYAMNVFTSYVMRKEIISVSILLLHARDVLSML